MIQSSRGPGVPGSSVTSALPEPYHGAEGGRTMTKSYAVLGGDRRQLLLAELLRQQGNQVSLWGFDREKGAENAPIAEAVKADVVILPLPVSWDGETLNLPLAESQLALESLWPMFDSSRQLVCGGNLSETVVRQAAKAGLKLTDYFDREEVQVGNAVPTAEGALQTAMEAADITICGAEVLIIGYGRIGKILARLLKAMGAEVTVSARKFADSAWIEAAGCRALRTGELEGELAPFDIVFNTVPSLVLPRSCLMELKASCRIIDVASEPGGVDFSAAKELGIQTIWARGLPGKAAPLTAARVLRRAIAHILEEQGGLI